MKVVEMQGITKRFGDFVANRDVNFSLEEGEIHGLLGENGAGKSTLMNMLYGLYKRDAGKILVRGKETDIQTPADAIASGIGMVHQHFMLIPQLTVTQNIFMGMKETGFVLEKKKLEDRVRELNDRFGFNVDPTALIWQLPVGVQQKVEILKVVVRNAKILIFDEPTAVLTVQEVDELFDSLKRMAREGYSIILITHKMREVISHCDRVTVMRDGAVMGTCYPYETDANQLAHMMVGRDISLERQIEEQEPGKVLFETKNLCVKQDKDINIKVHAGEIVGITGVDGNGQRELGDAISGLIDIDSGEILLEGEPVPPHSPKDMLSRGLGHIPDDRHKKGLILKFSCRENLILGYQRDQRYVKGIFSRNDAIEKRTEAMRKEFDVRCQSLSQAAESLSGGNQQKLILARVLDFDPHVILAIQPTRGLDVGAIEFVRKKLVEERNKGKAVLLISTDLDEVLALSDRIHVMYNGRLSPSLPYNTPVNDIGLMMSGLEAQSNKSEVIS